MDLLNIRQNRATATVEFMDESVSFVYRPSLVTPNTYTQLTAADSVDDLGKFFAELIVSWDLTMNGEEFPVTPSNVAELPMPLIRAIAKKVITDIPQREAGKVSSES